VQLLVAAGRANLAVHKALEQGLSLQHLRITFLPALSQKEYDKLLGACDLNFVRGEDSLVRAIWAGKPLVWHIYPQHDAAHHEKLSAFLNMLDADPSARQFHALWNGMAPSDADVVNPLIHLKTWTETVQAARSRLRGMDDLTTQLVGFAQKKGKI
jgi:uncharacterized repeat protein (TIGR03837 family)